MTDAAPEESEDENMRHDGLHVQPRHTQQGRVQKTPLQARFTKRNETKRDW